MRSIKYLFIPLLCFGLLQSVSAHINPNLPQAPPRPHANQGTLRGGDCPQGTSQKDMDVNNVRARLLSSGDVWWDLNDGRYIVPKVEPGSGLREVSSIFAGAVWLGGFDPAGNLKVAAQTYRSATRNDFWPGPLDPDEGTVDVETCKNWDKHFVVADTSIARHIAQFRAAKQAGVEYDCNTIPTEVKGWPSRGNPYFFEVHGFELPNTKQGLALFYDEDGDGLYNPCNGDYPVIDIRGCDLKQYPDQMIFWIYNDNGGIHTQTQGNAIQMEIQVQAFAYRTNDELNDMTFQRYKLINRATEDIDSTYFAMWVDPDLGCYTDDYIGCDTLRDLAIVYNEDALDGTNGCVCDQNVASYCDKIPILGVDYFRGPLRYTFNAQGEILDSSEIGMSSFTYYNNGGVCSPLPGTTDPSTAPEYYSYLSGHWRDGTPFTYGGSAYNVTGGQPINYAFTESPSNAAGWSMCTANLPCGDRRTIQASGPFKLVPGSVNELIVGVVWVPDQTYPCPDISGLQEADDLAQALFDNCFQITNGPDAPDVSFIELDRQLIAVLSNDVFTSNNAYELYQEKDLRAPSTVTDTMYRFEGYKIFQFSGPDVGINDINNSDKARLIYQVDVKNGINTIYNWKPVKIQGSTQEVWVPELKVEGADAGIRHTFQINEDQFAAGDRKLINHKKYYYTAIAYAYNNYETFNPDPAGPTGQRMPYLEGRRNIGESGNVYYTAIPRPIVDRSLNAGYGDGVEITRLDGVGVGGNFLDIKDETRTAILNGTFDGTIQYKNGRGPIDIQIFNPLDVKNGNFELTFVDGKLTDTKLDDTTRWELRDLATDEVVVSDKTIQRLNEQLIAKYGFSVSIAQTIDAGKDPYNIDSNGALGTEVIYADVNKPWLGGIPDDAGGGTFQYFDYMRNNSAEVDHDLDPKQALSAMSELFKPYYLTRWDKPNDQVEDIISPCWKDTKSDIVRGDNGLYNLNNVDIVLTPDTSKWSRCIVVETSSPFLYGDLALPTEGDAKNFDVRPVPSVNKRDADNDGKADPDGEKETDTFYPSLVGTPVTGKGWFPGYAIDVETGRRLNIFFGEASAYDGTIAFDEHPEDKTITRDMIWNPSSTTLLGNAAQQLSVFYSLFMGGQQYVYVTDQTYDGCDSLRKRLDPKFNPSTFRKISALKRVTWTWMPSLPEGTTLLPYNQGLIPNEVTVKLRVDNPYAVSVGTGVKNGYPTYQFSLKGVEASPLAGAAIKTALDDINVVPNPYYGFSAYETSQFTTTVKITNLPAQCTVTIYSLDGKFIRQYKRNETPASRPGSNPGVPYRQIAPDLEWDLKNSKGIPISSGVYLIHVAAPGYGERVLKWFGVNRQFDPSGL